MAPVLTHQFNVQSRQPQRPPTISVLRVPGLGRAYCCHRVGHRLRREPANSPQLVARSFPRKEDRRTSMTLAQFLTDASKLANEKARELGWIA